MVIRLPCGRLQSRVAAEIDHGEGGMIPTELLRAAAPALTAETQHVSAACLKQAGRPRLKGSTYCLEARRYARQQARDCLHRRSGNRTESFGILR